MEFAGQVSAEHGAPLPFLPSNQSTHTISVHAIYVLGLTMTAFSITSISLLPTLSAAIYKLSGLKSSCTESVEGKTLAICRSNEGLSIDARALDLDQSDTITITGHRRSPLSLGYSPDAMDETRHCQRLNFFGENLRTSNASCHTITHSLTENEQSIADCTQLSINT